MNNAIPAEKMDLVTPRAFSHYDPSKVPQTKHFQDVLENSLTENEIGLFCEDFLRLSTKRSTKRECHALSVSPLAERQACFTQYWG